jgi:hypothetical protein
MKKILSISLGLLLTGVTIAQSNDQIQNKKGVDIMPVKGEFAIGAGIGMSTLTGYFGNMFNDNSNNNLGNSLFKNNSFGGQMVFGKYMISDNNAIRAGFANNGYDNSTSYEVYDDRSNNPDSLVVDKFRENSSSTTISLGYEFRRGKTRLRGIYGAEALMSWSGGYHRTYTYGNGMSYQNMAPLTELFGNEGERLLTTDGGTTFGLGVRGFVGVEYFVAPKVCVGTEFGWSINYTKTSRSKQVTERFDIFATDDANPFGQVVTKETYDLGSRSFNSGLDNANAQLYLTFFF